MAKKKKRKKSPRYTPLKKHKKSGSKLATPLAELAIRPIDWARDLLPEHLWIAALAEEFGLDHFHGPYNAFLDTLDQYWTDNDIAVGLISDFALLTHDAKVRFFNDHQKLIENLFYRPIGRILAFYPEGPANWLIDEHWVSRDGSLDPNIELGKLRIIVKKLLPGKDQFSSRVRVIPLNRLLKHNKIFFFKDLPVVDLLPKYPINLNEEERIHVESVVRSDMNITIQLRKDLEKHDWPRYFWRHNHDLVVCQPVEKIQVGTESVSNDEAERLEQLAMYNSTIAIEYIDIIRDKVSLDLYNPIRDEILFGLFSRVTRLLSILMENPILWSRDVGGIILRCLAETTITFGYLVRKGTDEDFNKFFRYGEGQQKLLMLHLQDQYPGKTSLEGLTSEQLATHMGVFPELLDIELGHWTNKDLRRLSKSANMEHIYHLVFTPTSSDVHGTWLSLKNSNLTVCSDPLHRYHRIPTYSEPFLILNLAENAIILYDHSQSLAVEELKYPTPPKKLESILPYHAKPSKNT